MSPTPQRPIRFAVIGAGPLSRSTALRAFQTAAHARLAAIVSDDATTRDELGVRYSVPTFGYEDYDALIRCLDLDAVYIDVPLPKRHDLAMRAARAGMHVFCEAPMGADKIACEQLVTAAASRGVELMIADHIAFGGPHSDALAYVRDGALGKLERFTSAFIERLDPREDRATTLRGAAAQYIQAARYYFRDEPCAVSAQPATAADEDQDDSAQRLAITLEFPHDRVANIIVGVARDRDSSLALHGTRGVLDMSPAYDYGRGAAFQLRNDHGWKMGRFAEAGPSAAQLDYFAACIADDRRPKANVHSAVADVEIVGRVQEALRRGGKVPVGVRPLGRLPSARVVTPSGLFRFAAEVRAAMAGS